MNYEKVLQHLDELELFGIKLGLENITALCELLGNPQLAYKTIHVAGTNGKGSVVAMVANVLKSKYKVGMYTSPHLVKLNERYQINGEVISDEALVSVFEEVKEASDKVNGQVTYFEFTTAMAFLYFKKKGCDYVVIETGLGGRLDATNVVQPKVAVITNIELEHTQYLGDTKEKIAVEKAGIIKEQGVVIIGEGDKKLQQLLLKICNEKKSKCVTVVDDYNGKLPLLGKYQKRNAAVAVAVLKELGLEDGEIDKGIASVKWPGRLEWQGNVLLDAGHNPAGIKTTAEYVKGLNKEVVLVLGISEDKDVKSMVETIVPLAKKVIVTRAKYHGLDCEKLKEEVGKHCKDVEVVEDVRAAVSKAISETKDEIVLVTGSVFVVGEAV